MRLLSFLPRCSTKILFDGKLSNLRLKELQTDSQKVLYRISSFKSFYVFIHLVFKLPFSTILPSLLFPCFYRKLYRMEGIIQVYSKREWLDIPKLKNFFEIDNDEGKKQSRNLKVQSLYCISYFLERAYIYVCVCVFGHFYRIISNCIDIRPGWHVTIIFGNVRKPWFSMKSKIKLIKLMYELL